MAAHASVVVLIDQSELFLNWFGTLAGETTCVVPTAAASDAALRATIRTRMQARGIDCDGCPLKCPLSPAWRTP